MAGRRRERVALGIHPLLRGQVVAMPSAAGGTGNGPCHHGPGDLIQTVLEAAKAKVTQRFAEAVHERRITQQAKGQRAVRPVEQLDAARGFEHVDLVQSKLALEQIESAVCFAPRSRGEVRRTVDEDPRPIQRGPGARVAVRRRGRLGGHGTNLTR